MFNDKITTMTQINTPHDPLTRKYLLNLEVAKVFLQTHVSSEILAKCDLQSLTIEAGSYIEESLATHISDIVYRANLKDNSNCAYFYLLLEHQSSSERLMPYRVAKYQLAIIQNHIDKHMMGDDKKTALLPLVYPVIFYNGTSKPYPHPNNIGELFADPELYKQIGLGNFKLVDLTVISEEENISSSGQARYIRNTA